MKNLKNIIRLLTVFLMLPVLSCMNEGIQEPVVDIMDEIPSLAEQGSLMESSVQDIESLKSQMKDFSPDIDALVESIKGHVAQLSSGISFEEGTKATFGYQCAVGEVIGHIAAACELEGKMLDQKLLADIEKGVRSWVGEIFDVNYPVAYARARIAAKLEPVSTKVNDQLLYVDALTSDIEAGIRKDEKPAELASLSASVSKSLTGISTLSETFGTISTEVSKQYDAALKAVHTEPAAFDQASLRQFNTDVEARLQAVDDTYSDLVARVESCEAQLQSILERLGKLETDIEQLLELIQSVTFLSDYSQEKAVAYYSLDYYSDRTEEGYMQRKPASSLEFKYVVRPAAAATALADAKDMWNTSLNVFGYYAENISTKAVSAADQIDFNITNVASDPARGVITITLDNPLSGDFFFRKIGAKAALSVVSGKTDLTSKFVEIVPVDASDMVYVEGVTLSKDYVEIANGESANLQANVLPSKADEQGVLWSSKNTAVATVDQNGKVTAKGVGETTITVTTKGIDEWGLPLSANCKVKVTEAVRLTGAPYVEVGNTAELFLDYPPTMVVESKKWTSSDESRLTVDQKGIVTGVSDSFGLGSKAYVDVEIKCVINSMIEVSHKMKVVVPQPKSIKTASLDDNQSQFLMKVDEKRSLASTLYPEPEDPDMFRLYYDSDQRLGWINTDNGMINEYQNTMVPGTAWVYIELKNGNNGSYIAPGYSLVRTLVVEVEPYWVKEMNIPQSMTLAPDAVATITPEFISDVNGKLPTYMDLSWTSSDPSVVSVDEKTGEIKAHKPGAVTITATTTHKYSVPEGSEQKTSVCSVVVKEPTSPVYIGDYFYSDGTWSTSLDRNKELRGVVCQLGTPSVTDKNIPSNCINGYVVSITEISSTLDADAKVSPDKMHDWMLKNGYYGLESGDGSWNGATGSAAHGYSYTSAYSEMTDQKAYDELGTGWDGSHYGGWDFYLGGGALNTFRNSNPVNTEKCSTWYLPSQKEMTFLSDEVLTKVNSALTAAGKTNISSQNYKTSSYNTHGNSVVVNPVNKSATQQTVSTSGPIRFFLAF